MTDSLQSIRHLYPFRSHHYQLGGQRMHFVDEGQGEPLLLLHGNPTWSFYYRQLILGMSAHCRVVAPDHIGCGLSEKPQNYAYTLSRHIDNLERLVDHLGLESVTLGVHDWGGPIGFGYALRHPRRIRRFVVFNTAAFMGEIPRRIAFCRLPVVGHIAVRCLNLFVRGALWSACGHRSRLTSDVKRGYLLPYPTYRSRVAVHRFVQDIPTSRAHRTYEVVAAIDRGLEQLCDHPMIIFWGEQDFCFTTDYLEGWIRRFPQAEVHLFTDAGHLVVEDAHERILPLLQEFIAKTGP